MKEISFTGTFMLALWYNVKKQVNKKETGGIEKIFDACTCSYTETW